MAWRWSWNLVVKYASVVMACCECSCSSIATVDQIFRRGD